MMSQFGTKDWDTVHVLSSQAPGGFGRAAIGLETSIGPIAFEVDQKAIDALRRDLTAAEQLLRTSAARGESVGRYCLAQSMSRSRRTAGASGFFILSHWSVRPAR